MSEVESDFEEAMEIFKCTDVQCHELQRALEVLDLRGVKIATIVNKIRRVKSRDAPCPTNDYIRKIRNGGIDHPDHLGMQNLWDIVFDYFKDELMDDVTPIKRVSTDISITDFFGIPPGKTDSIKGHVCGIFTAYCYSELFNASKKLPCAIVVGRFDIDSGGRGLITVVERQKYDGSLGKENYASETSTGICFQRGHTIYFILKTGVRTTPKFYVFSKLLYNSDTKNIQSMTGYLLKGSADGIYFHSPVYAVRAGKEPPVCNILHPNAVDASIIEALNNELKVNHARYKKPKGNRPETDSFR